VIRLLYSVVGLFLLVFLTGCADTRYYWQSVSGHLQMLQAAKTTKDESFRAVYNWR